MNAARHEAAHAVALYLFGLADVLKPGGVAITPGGGITSLDSPPMTSASLAAMAARVEEYQTEKPGLILCAVTIEAARARPDLAPAIIMFELAGHASEADDWRGDFAQTIIVRTSSDFGTAEAIIADLLAFDGWLPDEPVLQATRDALDRAAAWAELPQVRRLIDAAAVHLEQHGAATWSELEQIFATVETSEGETSVISAAVPGTCPVIRAALGAVAGFAQPATAKNLRAENSTTERNEGTEK